jgi:hypothetical protein
MMVHEVYDIMKSGPLVAFIFDVWHFRDAAVCVQGGSNANSCKPQFQWSHVGKADHVRENIPRL